MTIKDILITAKTHIPPLDACVLLSHALCVSKEHILAYPNEQVGEAEALLFQSLLARKINHEPTQYITGKAEFMSLYFYVDENVLIPRPDTEILVETALSVLLPSASSLLELCTGSGCIAVALAHYNPSLNITATDVSEKALAVAARNAAANGVQDRIEFIRSDMFNNIKPKSYDLLICNPPYIPTADIGNLNENVRRYEPEAALNGGNDGLDFYRIIAANAAKFAKRLILEIGHDQAAAVTQILAAEGFGNTAVIKDLAGMDRVVTACP
jgi:release factor glutamine methyltransferase